MRPFLLLQPRHESSDHFEIPQLSLMMNFGAEAQSSAACTARLKSCPPELPSRTASRYFSFTKSNTKIAHTPTVTGNRTNCASRSEFPLGTANVSSAIAKAVKTPRANLVFECTVVHLSFQDRQSCTAEQQQSLRRASSSESTQIATPARSTNYMSPKEKGGPQAASIPRVTN